MAKVDLTQKITDFDGKPYKMDIDFNTARILEQAMNIAIKMVPQENREELVNQVQPLFGTEKTLKDIMITVLIVAEDQKDPEKKLEDYKLLKEVSTNDVADLGLTERERIFKQIQKVYNNVLIIGRCKEMLIEDVEKESKKSAKSKK